VKRLALYGLSADPPHLGHSLAMAYLSACFDEVWVWAVENPLKQSQGAALPHRQQMVGLTVAHCGCPNLQHRPEFSSPWTAESVAIIHYLYPECELWVALGSDALQQVAHWAAVELLRARATGWVEVVRNGQPSGLQTVLDLPIIVLSQSIPGYASQTIRQELLQGVQPPGLLTTVWHYVQAQKLYIL